MKNDLKLYILPGNLQDPHYQEVFEGAFDCWKSVWGEVYSKDMHLSQPLYADDFLRQDHIVAIFSGYTCAGLAMVRFTDFSLRPVRQDSYFRFWPETTLDKILKLGKRVAIASAFTVHPDFRQMKSGVCMKTLLLALFLKNFRHSDCDVMVTAARKVTSNEKLCSKLGSKTLEFNVPYRVEGEVVPREIADLIYWEKVGQDELPLDLDFLAQSLWTHRISVINVSQLGEVDDAA